MEENRSWLGFGRGLRAHAARAQTPTLITTQSDTGAPVAEQHELPRSATQIHLPQQSQKVPRLSRIGSFMGLGSIVKAQAAIATGSGHSEHNTKRSESTSMRNHDLLDTECHPGPVWQPRTDTEGAYLYREADQTWHNPSLTQMMETVSSYIMSNGVSEPIPRHLNNFVIGMIEEFRMRLGNQQELESKFQNLRTTHKKEIQEFAVMADEWKQHEMALKAEVKRLERAIAEKEGMHLLVAARAGSAFNRSDATAFQAKLDRLSKTEDEISAFDPANKVVMDGEMRDFAVLPTGEDSSHKIVLDHNSDALVCELYRAGAQSVNKHNTSPKNIGERMLAAQRRLDNCGRPALPSEDGQKGSSPRKSQSTAPSSVVLSSATSSVVAQGILDASADHVYTPLTSPPHPEPVKPCADPNVPQSGACNALQTIKAFAKTNGGLPEDAIDDKSSYGTSLVSPHQARAESSDHHDDNLTVHQATNTVVESKADEASHNGPQRFPKEGLAQVDGAYSDVSGNSSSSEEFQRSRHSATMVAMAHDCVSHNGSTGGPDCPRNYLTKRVQSGSNPFPDEATKYRYRIERTILNANCRERSIATTEELRAALDDRNYVQKAPGKPVELAHKDNAS